MSNRHDGSADNEYQQCGHDRVVLLPLLVFHGPALALNEQRPGKKRGRRHRCSDKGRDHHSSSRHFGDARDQSPGHFNGQGVHEYQRNNERNPHDAHKEHQDLFEQGISADQQYRVHDTDDHRGYRDDNAVLVLTEHRKIERQQFENDVRGDAENADQRIPLTERDADYDGYADQASVRQVLPEGMQRCLAGDQREISVGVDQRSGKQATQQQYPQELHPERASRHDHGGHATGTDGIADGENARAETQNGLDQFRHVSPSVTRAFYETVLSGTGTE